MKILEDKVNQTEIKDIEDIRESQKIIEKAIKENSEAIEMINS